MAPELELEDELLDEELVDDELLDDEVLDDEELLEDDEELLEEELLLVWPLLPPQPEKTAAHANSAGQSGRKN